MTKFLPLALSQGELTSSEILDIAHIEPDEKPTEPSIVSELNANLLAGGVEQYDSGSFNIVEKSDGQGTDELEIRMELKNDFIKAQAESGNLCTLLLTQYGDLRSFLADEIKNDSQLDSFGNDGNLIQDFDCLDTENINDETRIYKLV